jgi:hypothetical protein
MLRSVFAPYGKIPGGWPTGITQTRGPNGEYLQPFDPQYNTRDQAGYYHDTPLGEPLNFWQKRKLKKIYARMRADAQAGRVSSPFLGAIPTDFEMAAQMGYTPVTSGWIASQQGYITPPWLPPNGYDRAGYMPPVQPNDGGGRPMSPFAMQFYSPEYARDPRWNTTLGDGTPATVENVVEQMNAHNDRVFALALVSTTAVAVSAIITVFRTLRLIRKD